VTRRAYLLDAVRVPFGRRGGALSGIDTLELGAIPVREMIRRHPQAAAADAALFGIVVQAGLGQNPGRLVALRGGAAPTTPGVTLNSVCPASLEAVCDAARRISYGEGERYLVGGVDSMSKARPEFLASDGLTCGITGEPMGVISDAQNRELGITREAQDDWAYASHLRAAAARDAVRATELVSVETPAGIHRDDEGIRLSPDRAAMGRLRPAFTPDGSLTAGNSSQMADGAAAGLVVAEDALEADGARPLARIVDWAFVAGPDAGLHLKPARAISAVLGRHGLTPADVAVYEINEAFAAVTIATMRALVLDGERVNVHGGAVAIGHPLGATGLRLLLSAAHILAVRDGRYAVAALCGGGGQGLALLLERP
jgi:acetyl-CoA C-acetyltransferase